MDGATHDPWEGIFHLLYCYLQGGIKLDIIKEIGYAINNTEVGFFGVVLQDDPQLKRIVPTYITLADKITDEIKIKVADALIQYGKNIKADIKTETLRES